MIKAFTDEAWDDFEYWTKQDRKTLKRIQSILIEMDIRVLESQNR